MNIARCSVSICHTTGRHTMPLGKYLTCQLTLAKQNGTDLMFRVDRRIEALIHEEGRYPAGSIPCIGRHEFEHRPKPVLIPYAMSAAVLHLDPPIAHQLPPNTTHLSIPSFSLRVSMSDTGISAYRSGHPIWLT